MGFGYLFLGYLVSFFLYMTVQALGIGSLALLVGYAMMFYGLYLLRHYHAAFASAKWMLVPLLAMGLYRVAEDIVTLFLVSLPFVNDTVKAAVDWISFMLLIVFQLAMLYGIRMLADSIELKKISGAAVRNSIFVGVYAVLYLCGSLPLGETIKPYLTLSVTLLNLVFVVCNLALLVSCMKNICREGEEQIEPKRSRFAWVNRMSDTYEKSRKSLNDQMRSEGEALRQRRMEKKKKKK
ncbi:MAG: hypothetical protein IJX80_08905 [Clostridia bacterium]|nr:hypothetical protein [Clostridia bacterium]